MFPLAILGGAALIALFSSGCGSEKSDSSQTKPNERDAAPPESASAPSASASASSAAPEVSSAPVALPPPLISITAASAFSLKPCEVETGEEWKSAFFSSFADEARFKEMMSGGTFCVKAPLDLPLNSCHDSSRFISLISGGTPLGQKLLKFNLLGVPQKENHCGSLFSFNEVDCLPNLSNEGVLSCNEKPLLPNTLLLSSKVSLANLLSGDANGDGTKDLLVQFSNNTGVLLSQAPPCPPEGCNPEGDSPQ